MNHFESSNGIIFVTSIVNFNQSMNDANAMLESILLFKQLRRNPLIKDQCLVLFLNKMDLLGLKLSTLNQCFPDYDTSESLDHVLDN